MKSRRPLSPPERARVERRILAEADSRTMRLDVARELLSRISRKEEDKIADDTGTEEAKAKEKATADRDARLLGRARELARQVDALDKEMRATGVDRMVCCQIAHATRALEVAGRMLTPNPD